MKDVMISLENIWFKQINYAVLSWMFSVKFAGGDVIAQVRFKCDRCTTNKGYKQTNTYYVIVCSDYFSMQLPLW